MPPWYHCRWVALHNCTLYRPFTTVLSIANSLLYSNHNCTLITTVLSIGHCRVAHVKKWEWNRMSLFSSLNCDDFYHFPLKNRMIWPRLCQTLCLTPPIGKQCDLATRFARWGPLKIWNLKCVLRGHNLLVASRDVVNRLDSHVYKMWSGVHSRIYRSVIRPIIYNIYIWYIYRYIHIWYIIIFRTYLRAWWMMD